MTELGWKASGPVLLWSALGALVAVAILGPVMTFVQPMQDVFAGLVGSESVVVAWLLFTALSLLFGLVYGLFVATTSPAHGGWWGLAYGVIVGAAVWMIFPLFLATTTNASAFFWTSLGLGALWGLIVGVVQAWGLQHWGGRDVERDRAGARV